MEATTRAMTYEKPVAVCHSLGNLIRKRQFVKAVFLILALWLCIIVIAFSNQPSLMVSRFMMLTSYMTKTAGARFPDRRFFNITRNQVTAISEEGSSSHPTSSNSQTLKLDQVLTTVRTEVNNGCPFTDIDPFDPAILALTKFRPTLTCKGGVSHLVYLSGNTIMVNHSRTVLVGDGKNKFQECQYRAMAKTPGTDFHVVVLYKSEPFNNSITIRDIDDNVVVECYDSNKTVLSRSYFSLIRVKKDLETILETNYKKHLAMNAPKEVLSVLMIGIDGNSKQNFERMMPKTRNFLLNDLNAVELHKYNKVADNTYPNVLPMLTGKHAEEFPRTNWTLKKHFDYVNDDFVWSDFRKAGYRTGTFVDNRYITAFHYLKHGWNKPPVDYYYRTAIIEQNDDKLMGRLGLNCVGDIPSITLNHNYWIQLASKFNNSNTKPYFAFSFSAYLTHDDHNMASAGDELYFRFLKELADKNVINNTVIIFFSDHGERFGPIRNTYNGMIESRTPYVFLAFPPWFHQKYPELMKVLKINQERLTTNTDLYATLRDLVNFQGKTQFGDINQRGISLFQEIPRERTCEHASIPTEYCVCNNINKENISSDIVLVLATAVLQKLKQLISGASKCEELIFKNVQHVIKHVHHNESATHSLYQITIQTSPSDGIYEATLEISNSTKIVHVLGEITRLNMYKGQADCIDDAKTKPFCFCKDMLNTVSERRKPQF